jgi:sigma-B regulation protein RsbU (phosphoserine phosphatase)
VPARVDSKNAERSGGLNTGERQARILIVDDQQSSRMLIGSVLTAAGYASLAYAADGEEALTWLRGHPADMVILDIVMPRMDGFEVCRYMRGELGLDIPILIQTGVQEAEYRVVAFDAGASDIVSKPVNPGELVSRVRLHLDRRRMFDRLQRYQRRMEEELQVAQSMQLSLLASDADVAGIARPRGASVETFYQPSNTLGGDLWQILPVDERRFAVFMVDLSGHGVSAAINAFRVHMLAAGLGERRSDPAAWLGGLNRGLAGILPVEHFATAFFGIVDPAGGRLDYAAAGWPDPLILRAGGGWERLDGSGLILGCSDTVRYETRRVDLAPGDRLFVYSDALCENFEAPEKSFSAQDVAVAAQAALGQERRFAAALLERLFPERQYGLRDDLTLVLVSVEDRQ